MVQEVKQEMMLELTGSKNLLHVFVSNTDYTNIAVFKKEASNEFVYHGSRFDFVSVEHTVDGYIFTAVEDVKEQFLNDILIAQYEEGNEPYKGPVCNFVKNFAKEYMPTRSLSLSYCSLTSICNNLDTQSFELFNGYQSIISPPPDTRG